jgi:hypothetical protein
VKALARIVLAKAFMISGGFIAEADGFVTVTRIVEDDFRCPIQS